MKRLSFRKQFHILLLSIYFIQIQTFLLADKITRMKLYFQDISKVITFLVWISTNYCFMSIFTNFNHFFLRVKNIFWILVRHTLLLFFLKISSANIMILVINRDKIILCFFFFTEFLKTYSLPSPDCLFIIISL